jgi:hypothetical protein
MRVFIFLLLSALLIPCQNILSQPHYFNRYEGIPIIAFPNITATEVASSTQRMEKMKELGIYGFYAQDLTLPVYDKIIQYDFLMFPYQLGWSPGIVVKNEVIHYSKGIYTVWEAEGTGNGGYGNIKIDYNNDIGEISQDGKSVVTKSNAGAGNLIFGPYYYQYIKYPLEDVLIEYTAKYSLKIDQYIPESLPVGYEDMVVCTLRITALRLPYEEEFDVVNPCILKVRDFRNDPDNPNDPIWNRWIDTGFTYLLSSLKNLTDLERRVPNNEQSSDFTSEFMQYKVEFAGLPFLKLSVDNIIISDDRGRRLFNDSLTRAKIGECITEFSNDNYILGWPGIGEPASIDNYLPFRELGNLVNKKNINIDIFRHSRQ